MLKKTNSSCVNSDPVGCYCLALNEIHRKCLKGECPFYKTEAQFKVGEAKARRRCDNLGFVFKTRAEIIEDMSRVAQIQKERYEKSKGKTKVIQYNTAEQAYIEYDSLESASKNLGIPPEAVEGLIRKKESFHGYKFVYA